MTTTTATEHIVKSFDDELKQLSDIVIQMGGLAEAQLQNAVEALTRRDADLGGRVVRADARIEELMDELRQNFTIVIVTHSMQQAARVSQRTAFFHLGVLVEEGDTSDIFTSPRDQRTQDYITGRFG